MPVKSVGVLHLRPMAAMLHFEDSGVWNKLDDGSRRIEEDVLVIDGGDDQRRGAYFQSSSGIRLRL